MNSKKDFDGFSWTNFNTPSTPQERFLESTGHPFTYTGVSPPVALTSTYNFPLDHDQYHTPHDSTTYFYSRSQNPNFSMLSRQLCALHGGSECVVFASGMAAISATLFCLVSKNKKNTIVYSDELYHDGSDLLEEMKEMCNVSTVAVDILQTNDVIEKASQEGVAALFFDSSSNPNNKVPDFERIISTVRSRNPNCLFIVDNTFLSPALFRPFEVGIDIVVESGTKYLSGKGDALLGAVIVKFRPESFGPTQYVASRLQRWRSMTGGSPSPMSCWLISKGLETLPLRMDHVGRTTVEVARFLERVPCVSRVLFAGLQSHPTYEFAIKYFKSPERCGGVLRFHLPISMFAEQEFCEDVSPFVLAVSFGEAHTLICPLYSGYTQVLEGDKERGVPRMPGYWVRVAIGLQPAEEIKKGFLHLFARKQSLRRLIGSVIAVDGNYVQPDPKDKSQIPIVVNPPYQASKSPSSPTSSSSPNTNPIQSPQSVTAPTSTSSNVPEATKIPAIPSPAPTSSGNTQAITTSVPTPQPPQTVATATTPTPCSETITPDTPQADSTNTQTVTQAAAHHAAENAAHAANNAAENAELAALSATFNADAAAQSSASNADLAAQNAADRAEAAVHHGAESNDTESSSEPNKDATSDNSTVAHDSESRGGADSQEDEPAESSKAQEVSTQVPDTPPISHSTPKHTVIPVRYPPAEIPIHYPPIIFSPLPSTKVHQLLIDDTSNPNSSLHFSNDEVEFLFNTKTKKVIFVEVLDVHKYAIPEKKKIFSMLGKDKPKRSLWVVNVKTTLPAETNLENFVLCKLLTAEMVHKTQFKL